MKKLVYSLFCCLCILSAHAQWKWHNPMEAGFPVLQNQGFVNEIGKTSYVHQYTSSGLNEGYFNITNGDGYWTIKIEAIGN